MIAYDVESHSEFIEDGVSGYLVPCRDTTAMARRLALLIEDPPAAKVMGAAGRKKAMGLTDPSIGLIRERSAYADLLYP